MSDEHPKEHEHEWELKPQQVFTDVHLFVCKLCGKRFTVLLPLPEQKTTEEAK